MNTPAGKRREGRPWTRIKQQVFTEETHCWLCGQWVNQQLPTHHRLARTVDHIIPIHHGGPELDRNNCRLAHRTCNSSRGTRQPTPHNPRSDTW